MALTATKTSEIIKQNQLTETDTGSPEVQVSLLTTRINGLTAHFKQHKKDHHSRLGLLRMISRRRKLLNYLKTKNTSRYQTLIVKLGLRK